MLKLLASGAVAGFLETAELIKTWDDNGSDKLALNVFMNKTYAANALVLLASSSALYYPSSLHTHLLGMFRTYRLNSLKKTRGQL
ncbi:hypothetical protein TB2_001228 [Malus domestica]